MDHLLSCVLILVTIVMKAAPSPTFSPTVSNASAVVGSAHSSLTTTTSPSTTGSVTSDPVWQVCLAQVAGKNFSRDLSIAGVMELWCQNYPRIIACLSRDISRGAAGNPLDFFVNLTYSATEVQTKSVAICARFKENHGRVACSTSPLSGSCTSSFRDGVVHVFSLHQDKQLPFHLLRNIACEVTMQTTLCLRETLLDCEEDVQTILLNYYSLFTNETCITRAEDESGLISPETVVTKCAKEAAQSVSTNVADDEPASLLDFLILGLKTDCKTYVTRYECYDRELGNITNFRDFWLSLTFDHENAVASQAVYCEQMESQVLARLNQDCFNQSHPHLAACEAEFGRDLETIRDEWFNNPDLDGLQLQKLACRTSVTRAACLDTAMQPCGADVARAMAVSEMGILPDICRRLVAPESADSEESALGALGGNQQGGPFNTDTSGSTLNDAERLNGQGHNNTRTDTGASETPGMYRNGTHAANVTSGHGLAGIKEKLETNLRSNSSLEQSNKNGGTVLVILNSALMFSSALLCLLV